MPPEAGKESLELAEQRLLSGGILLKPALFSKHNLSTDLANHQ